MELLFHADEAVTQWVSKQQPYPVDYSTGTRAIGVVKNGKMIGGAVYSNYRNAPHGGMMEITIAGKPGWLTRRSIRVLLYYPFEDCGCFRVTCLVARGNKRSRDVAERLGFKFEGTARRVFSPHKSGDCMIYGLLKSENRWI